MEWDVVLAKFLEHHSFKQRQILGYFWFVSCFNLVGYMVLKVSIYKLMKFIVMLREKRNRLNFVDMGFIKILAKLQFTRKKLSL